MPCCPDVSFNADGKSTCMVDLSTLQFMLNMKWGAGKMDGSKVDVSSLTQIKDVRHVYNDASDMLLVVVEGSKPQGLTSTTSSTQSQTHMTYPCKVCKRFTGDGKGMRQHVDGHDLQSQDD